MSRTRSIVFLSLSLVLLSACDIVPPPAEVKESLTFITHYAPDITNGTSESGRQMERAVNQLNKALMEQATKDGSRSTLQLKSDPSNGKTNWPDTDDMVLLPLFSRAALEDAATSWPGVGPRVQSHFPSEHLVKALDKIDFKSQFALLVAHPEQVFERPDFDFSKPPQMSASYFDTLLIEHSPTDVLKLQLKTGRHGTPRLAPLTWQSKVYLLDRKNYKSLRIQWGDHSYDREILSVSEKK